MVTAGDLLSTSYISIEQNETIARLLGKLELKKSHEALVFHNRVYQGLVDERKFLKLRIDTTRTKVKKLIKRAPKLAPSTSLADVARLLATADSVILPVIQNKEVKGVVYVWDVLGELLKNKQITQLKSRDVCGRRKLVILKQTDPISKAISQFKKQGINRLPVVNAQGKLTGIVTPRDLLKKYHIFNLAKEGRAGQNKYKSHPAKEITIPRLPIKNEMEAVVQGLESTDRLSKAMRKMRSKKITALILTKQGTLDAVLTVNDILRLYS